MVSKPQRTVKRKRRTPSTELKARIALEALKGIQTINQIAKWFTPQK